MPSRVYCLATGNIKEVKNLGWLQRNAHKVASMELWELPEGRGKLVATICERGVPIKEYHTSFASFQIMQKWVSRPCLSHVVKYTHFRNIL